MHQTDVAIIGAGVAGALAAAMLGRQGTSTCLIDPIHPFGPDFRCEKLEHAHIEALNRAGLVDEILSCGERYDRIWIARQGYLVEKRPMLEYGIEYSALVNRLRALVTGDVKFLQDKVVAADLSGERPVLSLASGETVRARLVIGSSGLSNDLLANLGMTRRIVSRNHSVSIGFDLAPADRSAFGFDALTYFGEHPRYRVAYFTLFPMDHHVRANLFVYRDLNDPWIKAFRADPVAAIHAVLPRLRLLTGDFEIVGTPRVRPVDLVNTEGLDKPGVVMLGDAFSTACPVSGTGASKALVDAERLCNAYVAQWLGTSGAITAEQIAAFYRDPEKCASDAHSREVSLFAKRLALEPGLAWSAYRWARFAGSVARNTANHVRSMLPGNDKAGLQWQS